MTTTSSQAITRAGADAAIRWAESRRVVQAQQAAAERTIREAEMRRAIDRYARVVAEYGQRVTFGIESA